VTRHPRVVFGLTAYNRPDSLARTLESLLTQTDTDFAIVIVDDHPTPEVAAIVRGYASMDARIVYEPNQARLGMIGNWQRAFARATELFPQAEYFGWASDHDVWHPRWVEVLVSALEANPRLVLAYPRSVRMYPQERRRMPALFETAGIADPGERLRRTARLAAAGNCIYGLFRTKALAAAGVFRPVLMPDMEILLRLSLLGEFAYVPQMLWYREIAAGFTGFSLARQRRMLFAGGVPPYAYLPPNVQHFGLLVRDLVVRGAGPVGRLTALKYAVQQLWLSSRRELSRQDARWRSLVPARATATE
jgi:glycosyltransferase involved in cell wall biosynthesis